jgi:hypothetical protein
MTPNRGRLVCHLTAMLIGLCGLSASGCYVPGGGWTMRTGVDLRRHRKPSAFVELVDTRWDEYNRIAEINSMTITTTSAATVTPGSAPVPTEEFPVPPASGLRMMQDASTPPQSGNNASATSAPTVREPEFPGTSTDESPTGDEPTRLPGADDQSEQAPQPRDAPTARRSALDDRCMPASASVGGPGDPSAAGSRAKAASAKALRRPIASRLFSRPQ